MQKCALTPIMRLSFADLYKPVKLYGKDRNGYTAELLIPKATTKMSDFAHVKAVYDAAIPQEWVRGGVEFRPFRAAILDGDKKQNGEKRKQVGRAGMWMLKAQSGEDFPPRLKLADMRAAKPGDLYPGCWVRCVVSAFKYEAKDPRTGRIIGRGASLNLLTVQKASPPAGYTDEPFGSFVTEDEQDALLEAQPLTEADSEDLLA